MASTSELGSKIDRSYSVTPPPPPTVIECFQKKLPKLKCGNKNNYRGVGASSTTTNNANPPNVLICESCQAYKELADHALESRRICRDSSGNLRVATNRHMASEFKSLDLLSEEDVVSAFNLYMLAPMMEILKVLYPEAMWRVSSECTDARLKKGDSAKGKDNDKNKATAKEDLTGNLRYDMIFHQPAVNGEQGATIAIIEFKKPDQIRYGDFQEALMSAEETKTSGGKMKKKKLKFEDNALHGNADSYTKQVCKYASSRKCRHAALFNWDHLLIYDFFELGNFRPIGTAGEEAKLVWVHEGAEIGQHAQIGLIRKAMLGWLLNAFKDHFGW